jgi:Nif-specific regulatory protein
VLLESKRTIAVARLGDDPRFLNRLGLYDKELPFIAVPIQVGGALQGVLAVQPDQPDDGLLDERVHFVEMVANLIGQSVRLSLEVETERKALAEERDTLRRTVRQKHGFDNLVGHSAPMRRIFDQIRLVSKWPTTVLIRGETGTGKELIANAIHYNSPRARGPYVRLNCASLPETLLETELFGHEKGAFTGAIRAKRGLFEQAEGGTLFLDEIGDMPLPMQVKVLRAIQERQITRIGGERPIPVDFRLIAATHQDLKSQVEQGVFREDLYYRVNVIQIRVPALRERREDILWLAARFLDQAARAGDGRRLALTPAAERALLDHTWPGNVRELKHLLERARVLVTGSLLTPELLFGDASPARAPRPLDTLGDFLAGHEREYILRALESQAWQIQETANLLGISRKNLWEKMKRLEISRETAREMAVRPSGTHTDH